MEIKMKADLEAEIACIRDNEFASIKLEEAGKYRIKMQEYKNQLDKVYNGKLLKLKERENEINIRRGELEKMEYNIREDTRKDRDKVQEREYEVKQSINIRKRELESEKGKMIQLQNEFKEKTKNLEKEKSQLKQELNLRIEEYHYLYIIDLKTNMTQRKEVRTE